MAEEFVGGILNMSGARPGSAFQFDGPGFPNMTIYALTFKTTYEAIEKCVLPPPLKADRDNPPEVQIWYFVNKDNRAIDGRGAPYHAFFFSAWTEYNGVKGRAGWEYVDGIHGDKTEIDVMGPWAVYFGMAKKMADIRFTPLAPDAFEVTVTRRGTRLATLRMKVGAELGADAVQAINEKGYDKTLTVREIPSTDHSGFVDRSICYAPTDRAITLDRVWECSEGALEFGHLDLDPLSDMPILEIGQCGAFKASVGKEMSTEMVVIDKLPHAEG